MEKSLNKDAISKLINLSKDDSEALESSLAKLRYISYNMGGS